MKKNHLPPPILLGIAFIVGCSEQSLEIPITDHVVYEFSDFSEMTHKVYPVGVPSTSLRQDEPTSDWISWGDIADGINDKLAEKIELVEITSENDLSTFVNANSEFLRSEVDTDGETYINLTIDDKIRYFINQDRFYKIGNELFKVYANGTLRIGNRKSSDIPKEIDFPNIDDPDFRPNYESNLEARLNYGDPNNECGTNKVGQTTTGNQRTKVYARAKRTMGLNNQVFMEVKYEVKPFKKAFGSWHSVKRTVKGAWAIGLDYEDATGWRYQTTSNYITNPVKTKFYELTVIGFTYYWYGSADPGFHLSGVNIWADTPSTSYADVTCNDFWLCNQVYCWAPWG